MINRHYRLWQFSLILISFLVLMASFYFEYVQGLSPCPLCLMQRFSVTLVLLLSIVTFILGISKLSRLIIIVQMLVILSGFYFACRQMWLQSLPPEQIPACLPDLNVLMRYFPWRDVAHALFWGAGDCAEISWHWLGLTMASWVAIYFLGMFAAALISYALLLNKIPYWLKRF